MILVRHGQSEFNAAFNVTRVDPGIPDPKLTAEGRRQAAAAAETLRRHSIARLVVSPYTRTLETAAIIAGRLDVPITVESLVRERTLFVCDVGSPRSALSHAWPNCRFDHLDERWWPAGEESEAALRDRCARFRAAMERTPDWSSVAVVTHWGFIRGLTGHEVTNCEMVRFDPVSGRAEPIAVPARAPMVAGRGGIEPAADP